MSDRRAIYRLARFDSTWDLLQELEDRSLERITVMVNEETDEFESPLVEIIRDEPWAAPDWTIEERWSATLSHVALHLALLERGNLDPEGALDLWLLARGNGETEPIGLSGLPRAMESHVRPSPLSGRSIYEEQVHVG